MNKVRSYLKIELKPHMKLKVSCTMKVTEISLLQLYLSYVGIASSLCSLVWFDKLAFVRETHS